MPSKAVRAGSSVYNTFEAIIPGTQENLAFINAGSAASAAFATGVTAIRIVSDVDCYIQIAAAPTAASTTAFLPAKTPEIFGVSANDKIAARGVSGSGTLFITQGATP